MKKRWITILMAFLMVISTTSMGYCASQENNSTNVTDVPESIGVIELYSVPVGVTFGNETVVKGNCSLNGTTVSTAVAVLASALNVSGLGAYITDAVTTAISVGASKIYYTRKVAYAEDDQYYYVRTKVRLYSDSERKKPVSEWKTTYSKKSKTNGASTGELQCCSEF